jgi:hypothetical protein
MMATDLSTSGASPAQALHLPASLRESSQRQVRQHQRWQAQSRAAGHAVMFRFFRELAASPVLRREWCQGVS